MIERISGAGSSSDAPCGRPHVLLVVDQFPKMLGGGERSVLKIAEHLPRYGYHASILTFFVHPEYSGLESIVAPIYLLPLNRTYDIHAVRAAFGFRKFLRDQRVSLVQTFFESSDLWAGTVAKTVSDVKVVWSRRDMGILRSRKHDIAYRLLARLPDAVLAVSQEVREHCIRVDGIKSARVETIYNGVDFDERQANRKPQRTLKTCHVATVGNIRRVKGHDVMIRAAALLAPQFPEVSFGIAGAVLEPEYFRELEQLVCELDLTDRFHFAGPIGDLRSYLEGTTIFVLPSRSEGFSNAIIEAMAAGLPVVATNVGGNSESVVDGLSGIMVPPDDPSALANAISELLRDPPRARAMGSAGRTIVEQRFTTDAMMRHIQQVYRRLLMAS